MFGEAPFRFRALAATALLVALVIIASATAASGREVGEVGGQGPPPFSLSSLVSPHAISASKPTPVKLELQSEFADTPGFAFPPALSQITLLLDRHLTISTWGLPACHFDPQVMAPMPVTVPPHCTAALIGDGEMNIYFAFPDSKGLPLRAKALLYNGGKRDGSTRLWVYVPVTVPRPGAIVSRIDLKEIDQGRYGTEAVVSVPEIERGYGLVELLSLSIDRKYDFNHKPRSVTTFRCANGKFIASGEAAFLDGTQADALTVRPCSGAHHQPLDTGPSAHEAGLGPTIAAWLFPDRGAGQGKGFDDLWSTHLTCASAALLRRCGLPLSGWSSTWSISDGRAGAG
jgi:hypothetical protein